MNVIIPKNTSEYEAFDKVRKKAENLTKKLMSKEECEIMEKANDALKTNVDAVILYTLFKSYGFTAEQLKALYTEVQLTMKSESEANAYRVAYGVIPQRTALKNETGIDIDALYKENE